MKADEPQERLVKFGMVAKYQDKILERHAIVAAEQRAISNFWFAYALHVGPALRAAFDRISKRKPEPATAIRLVTEPAATTTDDLRRSLGLS
jgi:hypothetical protein